MKISRKIQKLTLAILLMLPSFSYAQETVLSFFPDSVNIELPEDFTVDIEIGNVESLYGFAGDIVYDPDILEVVTLDEGDFLNNGGSVPTAFFYDIDNVNGRVIVGLSILGSPGAYPSSANDTTLFSITFRSLTFGQDTLIFENTALFAPDGETQYPHETDTGLVIVSGEDQLVQLQLIPSDTTFENGDTLEVSFMISEASNVFSIALDIVYDPYLFQIDSMSFRQGNFLSEDHTVECQMLTDVHPEEGRAIIGIIRPRSL